MKKGSEINYILNVLGKSLMVLGIILFAATVFRLPFDVPVNLLVVLVFISYLITARQINQVYVRYKGRKDMTKSYIGFGVAITVCALVLPESFDDPEVYAQISDIATIMTVGGTIFASSMIALEKGPNPTANSNEVESFGGDDQKTNS